MNAVIGDVNDFFNFILCLLLLTYETPIMKLFYERFVELGRYNFSCHDIIMSVVTP